MASASAARAQEASDDTKLRDLMGPGPAASSAPSAAGPTTSGAPSAAGPDLRASDDAKLGELLGPRADDAKVSQLFAAAGAAKADEAARLQRDDRAAALGPAPSRSKSPHERQQQQQQHEDDAVLASALTGSSRQRSKSPMQQAWADDAVLARALAGAPAARRSPSPPADALLRGVAPAEGDADVDRLNRALRREQESRDDVALSRELELREASRADEEAQEVLERIEASRREDRRRRQDDRDLERMLAGGGPTAGRAAAGAAPSSQRWAPPPVLPAPTLRLRRPRAVHLPVRELQPGSLSYFVAIGDAASTRHLCDQARLCEERYLVNTPDARGRAPLHHAAYSGDLEVADVLLQAGADAMARDEDDRTPLHVAASRGSAQVARLLVGSCLYRLRASVLARFRGVRFDADLNEEESLEYEREAARDALVEYLRSLEDLRGNLLLAEDATEFTVVHYAIHDAYHGCLAILQLALGSLSEFADAGRADPVMSDRRFQPGCNGGSTLVQMLSSCLAKGQLDEIRREHLRRSQDLKSQLMNHRDPCSMTPLHLAALEGNYRAVPILLANGADASAKMWISVPGPEFPDLPQEVHEYAALDLSADSATRQALFSMPAARRATGAVPAEVQAHNMIALVSGDCQSVNQERGLMARTPLHLATFSAIEAEPLGRRPAPVMERLLRERPECDPLVADANGWTPLHYACAHGRAPELELLLKRATDLHGADLSGARRRAARAALVAETGRLDACRPRDRFTDAAKARQQMQRRARSAGTGGGECFRAMQDHPRTAASSSRARHQGPQAFELLRGRLQAVGPPRGRPAWPPEARAPTPEAGAPGCALGALAGRTLAQLAAAGAGPGDEELGRCGESGFVRCLELLQWRGLLDLEARDSSGLTPLLAASATGSTSTMGWLLDQGADCYATDNTKRSALHIAIEKKQRKSVRFLCVYDADVSRLKQMQDWKGRRPEELWRTGWLPSGAGQEGLRHDFATIWEAARDGDLDQLQRALRCDPDVNRVSSAGWTAAMYAAAHGNAAILRLLLAARCALEAPAESAVPRRSQLAARGRGPLHLAAEGGHADVCELLVDAGCSPVAAVSNGQTPLWAACEGGHLDVLQALMALRQEPLSRAGHGNVLEALGRGNTERHASCIRWLASRCCADTDDQDFDRANATDLLDLLKHGELARAGVAARANSATHKALQRVVRDARRRCDELLRR